MNSRPVLISEIMTKNPVCIQSFESVSAAFRRLFELDVRHLPVMNQGELVGIVSDRDLKGFLLNVEERMANPGHAMEQLSEPVTSIMQADPIMVSPDAAVSQAIDLFIAHKIGALPVVDQVENKLVGILSYIDILRTARSLFE